MELFGHEISNDIFSWDRPEYREMVCSFISVVDFWACKRQVLVKKGTG